MGVILKAILKTIFPVANLQNFSIIISAERVGYPLGGVYKLLIEKFITSFIGGWCDISRFQRTNKHAVSIQFVTPPPFFQRVVLF